MAAPSTPEAICNLALDELKQSPVNNISTPQTNSEFICARHYDAVRREALAAHPWKFAIKRTQWTPDPAYVPSFGYLYAYKCPADYIGMITVGDDYIGDLRAEREIEGQH